MANRACLNLTSQLAGGKKKNRKVSFINPNASNENLETFALAMAALSDNTLKAVKKVAWDDLTDAFIEGTEGDDWISVAPNCSIASGAGNDTLVIGSNISATITDFSADDILSLSPSISSAAFNDGVLTLGNSSLTLSGVDNISPFYSVVVQNGDTQTTLGQLLNPPALDDVDAYLAAAFGGATVDYSAGTDIDPYLDAIFAGTVIQTLDDADLNAYFDNIFN